MPTKDKQDKNDNFFGGGRKDISEFKLKTRLKASGSWHIASIEKVIYRNTTIIILSDGTTEGLNFCE